MRVAVNAKHGGFSLSDKAFAKLEEKGWSFTLWDYANGKCENPKADIVMYDSDFCRFEFVHLTEKEARTHPDVLSVIEELGEESFGDYSYIRIIEVPDDLLDWEIDSDDGVEHIQETQGRRRKF